ncbi:uncharacterized protein LOC114713696 [Neltuma alba]|uniref:uncharacterized protein LOC114713696 n=1 Tax=Neltuma alba TaxID=207710 RepID=UPI0010A38C83|nr:uncharacterized protein LOC114713696 [Prosopis alba]
MNNSIFVWNCQGAASNSFHRVLKSLLRGYTPDIVVLVEPRISGVKADRVIKKIGYPYSHHVEADGYSGGIWLMWNSRVQVRVLANHKQFIHTTIQNSSGDSKALFTAVYGSPCPSLRSELWEELSSLRVSDNEPWLIAGDFNATLSIADGKGGTRRTQSGCKHFQKFVHNNGLLDLGFKGPKYTWQRGNLLVRLDRALVNNCWISSQPLSRIWAQNGNLVDKIQAFETEVQVWNRETFGRIGRCKGKLQRRLLGIQRALERNPFSSYYLELERELRTEYENICLREEIIWLQKSRSQWIQNGDRNTKVTVRRHRNRILMLQAPEGHWEADQSKLCEMATNFFQSLYIEEPRPSPSYQYKEVRKVFLGGDIDPAFNRTLIALIPKTESPQTLKEFRPISLCTTVYKVITKVIANRLKLVMPLLCLPYQSSFIPR